MIRNYTTIQRVVEASFYTGTPDSFNGIVELTGIALASGSIRIAAGEWMVKLEENEFNVMSDEEFRLTYRLGGSIPGN